MLTLATQIEALLFALGDAMSRTELAKATGTSVADVEEAITLLRERAGGIVLVDDGREVELRTASEASELIERVRRDEFSRDIGRAGLEVLAALLYRGALSRSEVDFVRGVNSSQTLRTLAARGLIHKIPNSKDNHSFLYEPTTELLSALGVVHASDVPDFASVRAKLEELESAARGGSEQ